MIFCYYSLLSMYPTFSYNYNFTHIFSPPPKLIYIMTSAQLHKFCNVVMLATVLPSFLTKQT